MKKTKFPTKVPMTRFNVRVPTDLLKRFIKEVKRRGIKVQDAQKILIESFLWD